MTGNTPMTPFNDEADTDTLLEAFKTVERRTVLEYFEDTESTTVTITELAKTLRTKLDDISEREAKTILYHNHLPVLDEAKLVTYTPSEDVVTYHGHPLANTLLQVEQET